MRVTDTVTLQPFAKTAALVASSAKDLVEIDAFAVFEQTYPFKVAQGVMELFSFRVFYALIVSALNTAIELAKSHHAVLANPPLVEIISIENDKRFPDLPPCGSIQSANNAYYKPTSTRLQRFE